MTSHLETFANNGLSEPFYWLTRPTAVYHNGKTYVVWHGYGYDPYITYYDHTTKEWAEADAYCMVHNTGSNQSNTASMHFDSNGYPWIIYPEGSGTNWNFYHTRWNGSSWTTPVHITTTDNQFNYEDFKINSITNVTAYLNTSGEPGSGGNIEEWDWDGSAWSKVSTILSELQSGRPLGGPNIPYDDHEVRLVFSQYLDDDFSVSNLKLYAVIEDSIECPSLSASLTITPTTIISGESITYTSKAIGGVPDDNGFGHEIFIDGNSIYNTGLGKAREMSGTLQISDISASNHTVTSKITDGCLPTNQTATSPQQ